jgi:chromosomal replication initiator protein
MKIIVEFEFPKNLNEHTADRFIFLNVLQSIPFKGVKMKVLNRITSEGVSFDSIENTVCEYIQCTPTEINSKTRKRKFVEGRQICHHISKKLNLASLSIIGYRFGNKDHATVLHSNRLVDTLLKTDKNFQKKYKSLIESFET